MAKVSKYCCIGCLQDPDLCSTQPDLGSCLQVILLLAGAHLAYTCLTTTWYTFIATLTGAIRIFTILMRSCSKGLAACLVKARPTSGAALQEAQASALQSAKALRQATEQQDSVAAELQVPFLQNVIPAISLLNLVFSLCFEKLGGPECSFG